MSKTFRYTKITGQYYLDYTDEWEEDGVEFDYEVSDDELLPQIVNLLFEDYFIGDNIICDSKEKKERLKEKLKEIISDNYLIGEFADRYENALKEIFEEEALRFYND